MFEAIQAFRAKLASGQVGLGCGITLTDPSVIEALGQRPDFYWIDLEHAPLDYQALLGHLVAVRTTVRPALVRVRGSDVPSIKTVIDTGADGIIVPQIGSADEVRQVVEATRYVPLGKRGMGPRRAAMYGNEDEIEYVRRANQELFISVQIENVDALEQVDEIVAVEGIDSVVIGPSDLANSMGYLGQLDHADVVAAIGTIIEKTKTAGKFIGMGLGADEELVNRAVGWGVQWVQAGGDYSYMVQRYEQLVRAIET